MKTCQCNTKEEMWHYTCLSVVTEIHGDTAPDLCFVFHFTQNHILLCGSHSDDSFIFDSFMFKIFLLLHVNELNKHLFILYDFAYVIFCSYQIQCNYKMVCITENIFSTFNSILTHVITQTCSSLFSSFLCANSWSKMSSTNTFLKTFFFKKKC